MRDIFYAIWIPIIVGVFIWTLVVGFGRGEEVECYKWQNQAAQYPNFYLTTWQKGQCDAHQIIINAPVK